jgi:hypothetical protein
LSKSRFIYFVKKNTGRKEKREKRKEKREKRKEKREKRKEKREKSFCTVFFYF